MSWPHARPLSNFSAFNTALQKKVAAGAEATAEVTGLTAVEHKMGRFFAMGALDATQTPLFQVAGQAGTTYERQQNNVYVGVRSGSGASISAPSTGLLGAYLMAGWIMWNNGANQSGGYLQKMGAATFTTPIVGHDAWGNKGTIAGANAFKFLVSSTPEYLEDTVLGVETSSIE